jgi:hypothetical protein
VWWESQIERDFIYLLECDSDVITYREQPLRIHYFLDGKRRIYTPDFLVERMSKRQIVEVKPETETIKPEFLALVRSVTPICHKAGYTFTVATDRMIRAQPRLNNIKLFWRYSHTQLEPQHFVYCHEMMKGKECVSLSTAFKFFEAKGTTPAVVYALLYYGALRIDLMQFLNTNTPISLP